jgi:hypothetical protein
MMGDSLNRYKNPPFHRLETIEAARRKPQLAGGGQRGVIGLGKQTITREEILDSSF